MARYTGPSVKQSRRIGIDLGSKTNAVKVARRLTVPPGFHGRKGTKKISDFGIQMKEKQKVKWTYGVLEKQFRKYYDIATKTPAATGQEMLKLLERRLDNVIYRLNFAPTRRPAKLWLTVTSRSMVPKSTSPATWSKSMKSSLLMMPPKKSPVRPNSSKIKNIPPLLG